MDESDLWFQSFECESIPLSENTLASPRPPHRPRPRDDTLFPTIPDQVLVSFDCPGEPIPPGARATPRPPGRPRNPEALPTEADDAFAREVADRVLEYVNTNSGGLTAEQIAQLVQQLLSRRSA